MITTTSYKTRKSCGAGNEERGGPKLSFFDIMECMSHDCYFNGDHNQLAIVEKGGGGDGEPVGYCCGDCGTEVG